MFFEKFDAVIAFLRKLHCNNYGIWKDTYGITLIRIGENVLNKHLRKLNKQKYAVVISPTIIQKINISSNLSMSCNCIRDLNSILSIGGALEHNFAKELIFTHHKDKEVHYVAVPVPLSNDSFCTNRSSHCLGRIEIPTRETLYPSEILIDISLLKNVNQRLNLMGLGEAIGFYYSLMDYCIVRKMLPPKKIMTIIERQVSKLALHSKRLNKRNWLKKLSMVLLLKCLVMRINRDNQIGAGGDHLLAYAFEHSQKIYNKYSVKKFTHGEYVFIGSILMASLFPEWQFGFFSLKNLLNFGRTAGLLKNQVISLLVKQPKMALVKLSLQLRPRRPTVLSLLSSKQIENARIKLNEYLKL